MVDPATGMIVQAATGGIGQVVDLITEAIRNKDPVEVLRRGRVRLATVRARIRYRKRPGPALYIRRDRLEAFVRGLEERLGVTPGGPLPVRT